MLVHGFLLEPLLQSLALGGLACLGASSGRSPNVVSYLRGHEHHLANTPCAHSNLQHAPHEQRTSAVMRVTIDGDRVPVAAQVAVADGAFAS